MKHSPTMPIPSWEIPDPKSDDWNHCPPQMMERIIIEDKSGKTCVQKQNTSQRAPLSILVGRTFRGALNASDLDYMAKAILQMHDEMHELRERVRILEAGDK